MISDDGRVRVLDFGLARTAHAADAHDDAYDDAPDAAHDAAKSDARPQPATAQPPRPRRAADTTSPSSYDSGRHSSGNLLSTPLTHVGSVVGTPRFMAPEQHTNDAVDERADQFSFCVSLYYALYGAFPFEGPDEEDTIERVLEGRIADPPPNATVPRWLRHVLVRGLARRPTDRHPSMAALLAALRTDPSAARRRWLRGAAALLVVGAVALPFRLAHRQQVRLCAAADGKLAGVWDDGRRAAVRQAFRNSGKAYAEAALATVERTFDDYAHAWLAMHVDTCEATRVRGEQSEELLDLRMSCLDDRLTQLKTLSDVFTSADGKVVEHAAQSAQSLPGLASCADVAALRAPVAPPRDLESRQRVEAVRQRLARASALRLAARYDEGLRTAHAAVTDAEGLKYAPVIAEAQLRLGELLGDHGDWVDSARALHRGLVAGLEGHHEEAAAWAATELVQAVGVRQAHYDDGDRWAEVAEALAGRIKRNDEILGVLYSHRSEVHERQSKYDDALADATRALALELRVLGPEHATVAGTYHQLGNIYFQRAQYAEALDAFSKSLAIRQRTLGADHPLLAKTHVGMANVYGDSGDHERALQEYQGALAALERAQPDDPDIPMINLNMGDELLAFGRANDAFSHYQSALTDFMKRIGPSLDATLALNNMGDAQLALGQPREALRSYSDGEKMCERVLGPNHQVCGQILGGLGESQRRLGQLDEAAAHFQRSLAVGEKAIGPTHPRLAAPLLGLGRVALARHAPASARPPLERALTIREAQPGDGIELADVRFALAQTLWSTSERPRALTLAEAARAAYAKAGAPARRALDEVTAWLARRR
jgi:tetratricopeptide (TPR) repeat protein